MSTKCACLYETVTMVTTDKAGIKIQNSLATFQGNEALIQTAHGASRVNLFYFYILCITLKRNLIIDAILRVHLYVKLNKQRVITLKTLIHTEG